MQVILFFLFIAAVAGFVYFKVEQKKKLEMAKTAIEQQIHVLPTPLAKKLYCNLNPTALNYKYGRANALDYVWEQLSWLIKERVEVADSRGNISVEYVVRRPILSTHFSTSTHYEMRLLLPVGIPLKAWKHDSFLISNLFGEAVELTYELGEAILTLAPKDPMASSHEIPKEVPNAS